MQNECQEWHFNVNKRRLVLQLLDTTRYKLHQIHCGGEEKRAGEAAVTEPDWRCGGPCGLSSNPSTTSTDGESSRCRMRGQVRRALAAWKSSVRQTRILPENIWTFLKIFDINFHWVIDRKTWWSVYSTWLRSDCSRASRHNHTMLTCGVTKQQTSSWNILRLFFLLI